MSSHSMQNRYYEQMLDSDRRDKEYLHGLIIGKPDAAYLATTMENEDGTPYAYPKDLYAGDVHAMFVWLIGHDHDDLAKLSVYHVNPQSFEPAVDFINRVRPLRKMIQESVQILAKDSASKLEYETRVCSLERELVKPAGVKNGIQPQQSFPEKEAPCTETISIEKEAMTQIPVQDMYLEQALQQFKIDLERVNGIEPSRGMNICRVDLPSGEVIDGSLESVYATLLGRPSNNESLVRWIDPPTFENLTDFMARLKPIRQSIHDLTYAYSKDQITLNEYLKRVRVLEGEQYTTKRKVDPFMGASRGVPHPFTVMLGNACLLSGSGAQVRQWFAEAPDSNVKGRFDKIEVHCHEISAIVSAEDFRNWDGDDYSELGREDKPGNDFVVTCRGGREEPAVFEGNEMEVFGWLSAEGTGRYEVWDRSTEKYELDYKFMVRVSQRLESEDHDVKLRRIIREELRSMLGSI